MVKEMWTMRSYCTTSFGNLLLSATTLIALVSALYMSETALASGPDIVNAARVDRLAANDFVPDNDPEYVPGEIIVKLRPNVVSIDSINLRYGMSTQRYYDRLDIYVLKTAATVDLDLLAADMETVDGVVFAHPNYVVDPLQSVQGSFPFSDEYQTGTFGDQPAATRLGLPAAQLLATGSGVRVAVIDGGVNYNHPILSGAVIPGYDFVDDDPDPFDKPGGSNSGHGTFIAGIIHLVAPDAEIVAYRVSDTGGSSDGDRVAEAILQAVEDSCSVINLSLVMRQTHEVLRNAIAYARQHNVMVIAAAGNSATEDPLYPAIDPNVIAVAAVDSVDHLAGFSRYGHHIDLCAPGNNVYSTFADTIYAWWSGTSFAAPFVAGQAALKLSSMPGTMTWSELHAALTMTAENIDAANPGYDGLLGAGLMNPLASLVDSIAINTAWVSPYDTVFSVIVGDPSDTASAQIGTYSTNSAAVFAASVTNRLRRFVYLLDTVSVPGGHIRYRILPDSLPVGVYSDTVAFDVSGASNSPVMTVVTLIVSDTGSNADTVLGSDTVVYRAADETLLLEGVQNYPNPFNPETRITFTMKTDAHVRLVIYNTLGQEVNALVDRALSIGYHEFVWNGTDSHGHQVASGVYLYRISGGTSALTRKMLLLR
jgi:subtilisin family serine protease